ncbi:hypothetical protein GCM10010326_13030 [Streptomyces xanthochromogenes]|uniref:Integrase n=1 Tax=Streptomyces xanthochromogenes TaxID=67384 RepID=A0ABQ2ZQ61_9ACTN|nr:hypothetical protein GCM10010326_13030 [Streptomyces xanthochromogenes]
MLDDIRSQLRDRELYHIRKGGSPPGAKTLSHRVAQEPEFSWVGREWQNTAEAGLSDFVDAHVRTPSRAISTLRQPYLHDCAA